MATRIWLEFIARTEAGRRIMRERFHPESNYPIVCRNPDCFSPLGIFHTGYFTESIFLEDGVEYSNGDSSITCPKCKSEHDLEQYPTQGGRPSNPDEVPSEERVTLEEMPELLRAGITRFPEKD